MRHITIDLRKKPEDLDPKNLEADLIIEIDLYDDGYIAGYHRRVEPGKYEPYNVWSRIDRKEMVRHHVSVIRDVKPKTVVIRTGKYSTGHVKDIPIHPTVIANIINGTFDADSLTLG